MTTLEAIEIVTNAVQSSDYDVTKDMALRIVQKAVEKQIPTKPVKENEKYDACPLCGRIFLRVLGNGQYCKWCGQFIDLGWHDDDE